MSEKIEQTSLSTIVEEPEPLQINDVGDAFNQTVQSHVKTDEETFVDSSHPTSKTSIPTIDSDSPSYKCLKVISQSDSVLVNPQLLYFPEPGDPGIDAAFNFQEPEEYEDNTGCHRYRKKCAELHVMPISTVLNSLNTEVLNLKYYGLTEKQMLTIWEMLKINTSIKELNLQDNWMSKKAVIAFESMLIMNMDIKVLNLRECRLGPEGISALSPAFPDCFITDLDLSFNNLGNEGIIAMEEHLKENTSIRKLNLSHNELDEICAKSLQGILKENETIEELDLSWNCFNTRDGNKRLFTGLLSNQNIKSLNLSWNGLNSEDCVKPLVQYMVGTKVLEYLDLSNNILRGKSLDLIRVGLIRNSSLIELKLGKNIFDEEEALTFATAMLKKNEKPLKLLDMTDMRVPKRFIKLLNKIREIGRDVIHGRRCDYDIYGPNIIQVIFDRCKYLCKKRKKKTRKLDFGVFLLSIPDIMMSPNEFEALLIKKKIRRKLDDDLLKELMFQFSVKKGKDYRLDIKLMLKAYFSFNPEVSLPLKKVARKKRGKSRKKGKKKKKRKGKSQGIDGKTGENKAEPAEIKLEATDTNWDFTKTAFKKYSFPDLVTVDLPAAPQTDKEFEDCLCPERKMIMMAQQASLQAEPPSKVDKMKSSSLTTRSSTEPTKKKSFSDHPHPGTLKKASLQAEPPSKVDKMKSSSLKTRSSTESTKKKSLSDHPHPGTLKKASSQAEPPSKVDKMKSSSLTTRSSTESTKRKSFSVHPYPGTLKQASVQPEPPNKVDKMKSYSLKTRSSTESTKRKSFSDHPHPGTLKKASVQAEPPSKVDKMKSYSLKTRSSTESTKRKSFSDHPHPGTFDSQQQSMKRQSERKLSDPKSKSSKQSSMQAIVSASNEGNFSKSRI